MALDPWAVPDGLRAGSVGLGPGASGDGPVLSDDVVVAAEPVELTLDDHDRGGGWLCGQPLLLGLEPLDFPAGLRVVGPGVVEADAEQVQFELEGDPATRRGLPVNTAPLSVSTRAGMLWLRNARRKLVTTSSLLVVIRASETGFSRDGRRLG